MKKTLLTLAIIIAGYCVYAQTNTFPSSGSVGIGTSSPTAKLSVVEDGISGATAVSITNRNNSRTWGIAVDANVVDDKKFMIYDESNSQPRLIIDQSGNIGIGTITPKSLLTLNNNGSGGTYIGLSQSYVDGNDWRNWVVGTNNITFGDFNIKQSNLTGEDALSEGTSRFYINPSGNVGIGTTTPDQLLSVAGTIHSKEVKVDLMGWPDYVFKPTYKLPSLLEVKNYIDQNQHLPDMPSEQQVTKDGINLGEIVKVQTKKIEELTLYMIDKDKQVNKLQDEVNQLREQQKAMETQQDQINELKNQLSKLLKQ